MLSHLDIELTERCNNNCIHCYINRAKDDPAKQRELTTDELKAALDQAASLGCMSVMFTGGEPLLREDFEELYVYTRKLGISVTIRTNATLISPHLAGVFARIPPKSPIAVTVYGTSKRSYEAATRTPGSYDAFIKGIGLLTENKVPFELSCAITRHNIKEVDSYKSWPLEALGEEKIISYSLTIDLSARRDDGRNNILQRLRISPEEVLRIRKQSINHYDKELKEFCKKFAGPAGDVIFSCGSCIGACTMDAYGNLQPCIQLRHPGTVYNLKNGSIKEAMTEFFPRVREARAKNEAFLSRCAHCFLRGLCDQCPAKSWMEHGTMDTPVEYLCELAHIEARDIGLLRNDEKAWEVEDWKERINSLSKN